MKRKLLQSTKRKLRREPREFIFEPVSHRLNPKPLLPQGLMSAIAPAYEEALAREKEEGKIQGERE